MDFSEALRRLKDREQVMRSGWNGKGMWLVLVRSQDWDLDPSLGLHRNDFAPWIGMRTAQGTFVPWLASQTDLLADDWELAFPAPKFHAQPES